MSDKKNMSDKTVTRNRAPNFSKAEQILLFNAMEPYAKVIENKKTDTTKQIDKQRAWLKITDVFNANTKGAQRSTENLISCYRNVKSKLKKQSSEAKMLLQDPIKKDGLINALEEHGKDWRAISNSINTPEDLCQSGFKELQIMMKKDDLLHKKEIMGTGGGPPPTERDPFVTIKKLIDPQMDGLYTIYDGDAEIMKQFQNTKPIEEQKQPIEFELNLQFNKENENPVPSTSSIFTLTAEGGLSNSDVDNNHGDNNITPLQMQIPSRTDFLRKRRAPELENGNEHSNKKRKAVNDNFLNLSTEKLQLVEMQKKMIMMEIEHKKKLFALELEDKIKENEHKNEMRQKELYLIELKIKNASQ